MISSQYRCRLVENNNSYMSKEYSVEVRETLSRIVKVNAINEQEAEKFVQDMYQTSAIVLDANDNVETVFEVLTDNN